MSQRWAYDEREALLEKIEELVAGGVARERIEVLTPVPVHEATQALGLKPSRLPLFTLIGALGGLLIGFAFPILTVRSWPLVTGGKPLISIPPFVIIGFALTILLGALASFAGFLFLARVPSVQGIRDPEEHDNRFVILLRDEEPS